MDDLFVYLNFGWLLLLGSEFILNVSIFYDYPLFTYYYYFLFCCITVDVATGWTLFDLLFYYYIDGEFKGLLDCVKD